MTVDKLNPGFQGKMDNMNEAGACECTDWAGPPFTLETVDYLHMMYKKSSHLFKIT